MHAIILSSQYKLVGTTCVIAFIRSVAKSSIRWNKESFEYL